MIKLGCCIGVPVDEESRKKITQIKEAGFDYVEYNFQTCAALTEEEREAAVQFTKDSGLECLAMNCFIPGDIPLVGPDADLGKAKRFLDQAFPAAKAFGAKTVVFGSGGARRTPPGFSKEIVQMQLVGFLRLVETYCEDYDINIAIEPLNVVECNTLNTLIDGYWLAADTNRPHIRLLVDYYHFQRNQENVIDMISSASRLEHVHLANCIDRGYPVEETKAEHKKLFDTLKQIGYEKTVSIEAVSRDFETEIAVSGKILQELR